MSPYSVLVSTPIHVVSPPYGTFTLKAKAKENNLVSLILAIFAKSAKINLIAWTNISSSYIYVESERENPPSPQLCFWKPFWPVDYIGLFFSWRDWNIYSTAPGNVADHVTIERQSESTIMLADGARDAYLGYVTLKVSTTSSGKQSLKFEIKEGGTSRTSSVEFRLGEGKVRGRMSTK